MLGKVSNDGQPSAQTRVFLVVAEKDAALRVYEVLPQELDRLGQIIDFTNGKSEFIFDQSRSGVRRYGYEHLPRKRVWRWKRKDGASGLSMIVYATSRTLAAAKFFEQRRLIEP